MNTEPEYSFSAGDCPSLEGNHPIQAQSWLHQCEPVYNPQAHQLLAGPSVAQGAAGEIQNRRIESASTSGEQTGRCDELHIVHLAPAAHKGNSLTDIEHFQHILDTMKKRYGLQVYSAYWAAKYHTSSFPAHLRSEVFELANEFQDCLLKLDIKISEEHLKWMTRSELVRMEEDIQKWLKSDVGKYSLWFSNNYKERLWTRIQRMKKLHCPAEKVCIIVYRRLMRFKAAGNSTPLVDYFISMCELSIRLLQICSAQDLSLRLTIESIEKVGVFLDKDVRRWYHTLLRNCALQPEQGDIHKHTMPIEARNSDSLRATKTIKKSKGKSARRKHNKISESDLGLQVPSAPTALASEGNEALVCNDVVRIKDIQQLSVPTNPDCLEDNEPAPEPRAVNDAGVLAISATSHENMNTAALEGNLNIASSPTEALDSSHLPNAERQPRNDGGRRSEKGMEPNSKDTLPEPKLSKRKLETTSTAIEQERSEKKARYSEGLGYPGSRVTNGISSSSPVRKDTALKTETIKKGNTGAESSNIRNEREEYAERHSPILVDGIPYLTEGSVGDVGDGDYSPLLDLPPPALALLEAFNASSPDSNE